MATVDFFEPPPGTMITRLLDFHMITVEWWWYVSVTEHFLTVFHLEEYLH